MLRRDLDKSFLAISLRQNSRVGSLAPQPNAQIELQHDTLGHHPCYV